MRNQELSPTNHLDMMATAIDEIRNHNAKLKSGEFSKVDYEEWLTATFNHKEETPTDLSASTAAETAARDIVTRYNSSFEKAGFGLLLEDDNSVSFFLGDLDKAQSFCRAMPDDDGYPMNVVVSALQTTVVPVVRSLAEIDDAELIQQDVSDLKALCDEFSSRRPFGELDDAYQLIDAALDGYLKEQVLVNQSKILCERELGAASWHRQDSATKVYNSWTDGLSVLKEIKINPKAQDLTESVARVLSKGIESFEASLQNWTADNKLYPVDMVRKYEGVARLVRGELEAIKAKL